MQSDIVQRLMDLHACQDAFSCDWSFLQEAAAEITRLTEELRAAEERGDERHAAGYQAVIADVVEWLRSGDAFALTDHEAANEITRRFGKGRDHG